MAEDTLTAPTCADNLTVSKLDCEAAIIKAGQAIAVLYCVLESANADEHIQANALDLATGILDVELAQIRTWFYANEKKIAI